MLLIAAYIATADLVENFFDLNWWIIALYSVRGCFASSFFSSFCFSFSFVALQYFVFVVYQLRGNSCEMTHICTYVIGVKNLIY